MWRLGGIMDAFVVLVIPARLFAYKKYARELVSRAVSVRTVLIEPLKQ